MGEDHPDAGHGLLQDSVLVKTRADSQDGRVQLGNALAQHRCFRRSLVEVVHGRTLPGSFAQVFRTARTSPLSDLVRDAPSREIVRLLSKFGQYSLKRHYSHWIVP